MQENAAPYGWAESGPSAYLYEQLGPRAIKGSTKVKQLFIYILISYHFLGVETQNIYLFCLFPVITRRFSTLFHIDPAANQDHCER